MTEPRLAIIWGLTGLMGASLGLALRQAGYRVAGIGRNIERLKAAQAIGAADDIYTDATAIQDTGLVFLCTPVDTIMEQGPSLLTQLPKGSLVMDLGSVKEAILNTLEPVALKNGLRFVAAHPMAGSEKTGFEHARADLYDNAVVALTPSPQTPREDVDEAFNFWKTLGASPLVMDAAEHDRAVAGISHLPHLNAALLVLAALQDNPSGAKLAATGFQDSTRLAGGDPALWRAIIAANGPAVGAALDRLSAALHHARTLIATQDWQGLESLLQESKEQRRITLNAQHSE